MNNTLLLVAAGLAVAACGPTKEDREAERSARWSLRLSLNNAALTQRICAQSGDIRCAEYDEEKAEVSAARAAYVAACRKCASAERCEDEARRIMEGRAGEDETACPD